jgi:6-phosphogluconolactonase
MNVRVEVREDAEAAARFTAEHLAAAARRGGHIVLTGGDTPRRAYEIAAELEPDWSRVEVWWGDERCVPPSDSRSNFRLAKESLLDRLRAQPEAVHRMRGEIEPAEAAAEYELELGALTFDLVLNGLGPDGHAASLFPNAPALDERERLVVAADPGLEPFVERVTMTIPALERCREMIFLVVGEDKADAVRRVFGEPPSADAPAGLIRSRHGETLAVLDPAAAAELRT